MKCTVYRSLGRPYTYIYLAEGHSFDDLPASLREAFEPAEEALRLDLGRRERLAQEDIVRVRSNLASQGWHLQLPPTEDPSGWLDLPAQRVTGDG